MIRLTNKQVLRLFRYWFFLMWSTLHQTGNMGKIFAMVPIKKHYERLKEKYILSEAQTFAIEDSIRQMCPACGYNTLSIRVPYWDVCRSCPCGWGEGNCGTDGSAFFKWCRTKSREKKSKYALEVLNTWRERP